MESIAITLKRFAGFLITYERPSVIKDTIDKILQQSVAPEKLLIVDNSDSSETERIVSELAYSRIEYSSVGFNAGPAGAAHYGLRKLAEEGYSWIAWSDDDPPQFEDSFEKVLGTAEHGTNIGIVGAVGSRFSWSTGMLKRLEDHELKGSVPVDSVAGGMVMVINAEVIKKGVLPNPDLFFGFEELDFCLRTKLAGFEIVVNGELAYRYRQAAGRLNMKDSNRYKGWKFSKSKDSLWREYYSIRNFAYLMRYKYKRPVLVFILLVRVLYKMLTGFTVYRGPGWLNFCV